MFVLDSTPCICKHTVVWCGLYIFFTASQQSFLQHDGEEDVEPEVMTLKAFTRKKDVKNEQSDKNVINKRWRNERLKIFFCMCRKLNARTLGFALSSLFLHGFVKFWLSRLALPFFSNSQAPLHSGSWLHILWAWLLATKTINVICQTDRRHNQR